MTDIKAEIIVPGTEELQGRIALVVQRANMMQVTSPAEYTEASEARIDVKKLIKQADAFFDPMVEQAYRTYKLAGQQKKDFLSGSHLLEADQIISQKILSYESEEQRKQRIAQAAADAQARKDKEAAEKKANAELKKGNIEKAQAIVANIVPPVIPQPNIPKVSGQYTKETWHAEITDITKVPREYLVPDMVALNKMAGVLKETRSIPGVKFVSTKTLTNRLR